MVKTLGLAKTQRHGQNRVVGEDFLGYSNDHLLLLAPSARSLSERPALYLLNNDVSTITKNMNCLNKNRPHILVPQLVTLRRNRHFIR